MRRNTTTVRITWDLHGRLQHLATTHGKTMQQVLEEAIATWSAQSYGHVVNQGKTGAVTTTKNERHPVSTADDGMRKIKQDEARLYRLMNSLEPLKR